MKKKVKTETDKLKYGSMYTSIFDLPKAIADHIKSKNWVHRWGSKTKFDKFAGTDLRGYIAYRVPSELKVTLEPGEYGEDYQISTDGLFHRGDMILLVMPRQRREYNMARLAEENKMDKERIKASVENRNLSAEEITFENVLVKSDKNLGE